jgi:Fe-S-cluster containining protein
MDSPLIQITKRPKRRRRLDLTREQKSELCQQCGKCCMAMTFEGGPVDQEELDHIRWLELHGFRIEYHKRRGTIHYYYSMMTPCQELKHENGRYSCGIYETRPQLCRDYEGWAPGPTGVPDCLWYEPEE